MKVWTRAVQRPGCLFQGPNVHGHEPPPQQQRPPSCALQPVYLHGSLGREAATGRGTAFAIRELLKASHSGRVADKSYVIQVRKGSKYEG